MSSDDLFECEVCGREFPESAAHVTVELRLTFYPPILDEKFLRGSSTLGICCRKCWDGLTPLQQHALVWPVSSAWQDCVS